MRPQESADVEKGVRDRLAAVRKRIRQACDRSRRDISDVTLIGASKTQPVEKLLAAWRFGLGAFGENRVQEASGKRPALPPEAELHLFGPLQSNKAKAAVELFDVIHSVDRPKIARALDRQAGIAGKRLPCFLEINLAEEASKHGFSSAGLAEALEPLVELDHLDFVGLMAIPPFGPGAEAARPWFRRLRELAQDLRREIPWRDFPGLLSMGMSQDFEIAVEEGATHIRVGTALFGRRATG